MSGQAEPELPQDRRALIAVDLGAESCRISLMRWRGDRPEVELVYRFGNAPRERDGGWRWDLQRIVEGVEQGVRQAAAIAAEGIRSIAVDGWAVDYVRIDAEGRPLDDPFCYRDERTVEAEAEVHGKISAARMRELTGIQILRINTLYQLYADKMAGRQAGLRWLNLPEYLLARWGGEQVAEYTMATHTQMAELGSRVWCREVFDAAGLSLGEAPPMVPPGTVVGKLSGELAELPGMQNVMLVAPGCHDTASAIAGIPATGDDWAYISSGTWSLVGTVLDKPENGAAAKKENFTNLGAVGGGVCFHRNVNGMWLLQQCMDVWALEDKAWEIGALVSEAETAGKPDGLLDVDEPDLLLAGNMPARINAQRSRNGLQPLSERAEDAPAMARLIFESLAARYGQVLREVGLHSGKRLKRLFVVGGASRNEFLNRLTEEVTGLKVIRGAVESSTIGNLAVQLAVLDEQRDEHAGVFAEPVSRWAGMLSRAAAPIS